MESVTRHEQVRSVRLRFERCFFRHRANDGRSVSRNVASLNLLVYVVINLLYYGHWTDKWNYFYVCENYIAFFCRVYNLPVFRTKCQQSIVFKFSELYICCNWCCSCIRFHSICFTRLTFVVRIWLTIQWLARFFLQIFAKAFQFLI